MKRALKIMLFVLLFTVSASIALFFTSCLGEGDSDGAKGDGGSEGSEGGWDGIRYNFEVKFKVPDSDAVYVTSGRREEYKVNVELDSEKMRTAAEYKELRADSTFAKNGEYLGLFNAPIGGIMCYDAAGNNKGVFSDNGMYYAQFDMEFRITYEGITDQLTYDTYHLPTSVQYGQELGIAALPVMEKEGHRFVGWYCNELMAFVTDRDGVFLSGYALVDEKYRWVNRKLTFKPRFEEETCTVTFDYNDGSYRISHQEWAKGSTWEEIYPPHSTADLRELVAWSTDPYEIKPFEGELTEDIRLYAHWRSYRYIVVVTSPGNEMAVRITEGENYELETPYMDGFTFGGWYPNELKTGLPLSSTVTYGDPYEFYYARWEENG